MYFLPIHIEGEIFIEMIWNDGHLTEKSMSDLLLVEMIVKSMLSRSTWTL